MNCFCKKNCSGMCQEHEGVPALIIKLTYNRILQAQDELTPSAIEWGDTKDYEKELSFIPDYVLWDILVERAKQAYRSETEDPLFFTYEMIHGFACHVARALENISVDYLWYRFMNNFRQSHDFTDRFIGLHLEFGFIHHATITRGYSEKIGYMISSVAVNAALNK